MATVDRTARYPHARGDAAITAVAAAHSPLVSRATVPLRDLLLDPGNELAASESPDNGAHDEGVRAFVRAFVPRRAYERLCAHGIAGLQSRIEKVPASLEGRILVRRESQGSDGEPTYVVVDGSWHVAALRHLAEVGTIEGGPVPSEVIELFDGCPVTVVEPTTDPALVLALLADPVHHHPDGWVRGQRDRLLTQLCASGTRHTREGVTTALGGDTHAMRRYHAYLALQQLLQVHPLEAAQAAELYPLFYAAVGRQVIRDWLDWDDHLWRFLDDTNLAHFHRLLSPRVQPDHTVLPPSIRTVEDVVHLCDVLGEPEALHLLLRDNGTLQDAVDHVNAGLFHHMTTQVSEAIGAIQWDRRRFDRRRT